MPQQGTNQGDLVFNATLNDNVSPQVDKLVKKMQQLGASTTEIKMSVNLIDNASARAKLIRDQIESLPTNIKIHVTANVEQAKQHIDHLRHVASAPVHLVVRVKDHTESDFNKIRSRFTSMKTDMESSIRNSPLLTMGHNVASAAANTGIGSVAGGGGALGSILSSTGMGAVGGVAVGAGVAGLINKSFDYNKQLEQSMTELNAIVRDKPQSRAITQQVQAYSATTPFNYQDVLHAQGQLLGAGVSQTNPINIKTVGALAAGSGTSQTYAVQAITEARRGYYQGLGALNIPFSSQDIGAGGRFQGLSRDQAINQAIQQRYGAAMEGQLNTWHGLKTNLQDATGRALGTAGKPLFDTARGIEKHIADRIQTPEFQRRLGIEVDKVQKAFAKVYETIQKGAAYFKNNLEDPLKRMFAAVVQIGSAVGKAFGGTALTIIKTLGEAFTSVVVPLTQMVTSIPLISPLIEKLVGANKALSMLGLSSAATPFKDLGKSIASLNFVGFLKSLTQIASTIPKIAMFYVVKDYLDMRNATNSLTDAFHHMGVTSGKVLDGVQVKLDAMAASYGKTGAYMKGLAADVARVAPSSLYGHPDKLSAFATTGAKNIATGEALGFGNNFKDLYLNELKFKGTHNTGGENFQANKLMNNADALSKALGVTLTGAVNKTADALRIFGNALGPKLAGDTGATLAAALQGAFQDPRAGGITNKQVKAGINSPNDLVNNILGSLTAPSQADIKNLASQKIPLSSVYHFLPNYKIDSSLYTAAHNTYGAGRGPEGVRPVYHHVQGGIIGNINTQDATLSRGIGDVNKLARQYSGGIIGSLPHAQDLSKDPALRISASDISTPEKLMATYARMAPAIDKVSKSLDSANAAQANYEVQTQVLDRVQSHLSNTMANFQFDHVTKLSRQMEDLGNSVQVYQHNAVLPIQRAQEDWNHVMELTSRRVQDVNFAMGKAQYNLQEYAGGLLKGENSMQVQIHAMDMYLTKLDLIKNMNMGMQADLTSTSFSQGFSTTIKPLMGFSLERQTQIAQRKQAVMQDQNTLTYGDQHWQLDRAQRTRQQAQEHSFGSAMTAAVKYTKVIDAGVISNRHLADVQQAQTVHTRIFTDAMYATVPAMRSFEDKTYSQSQAMHVLNLHMRTFQNANDNLRRKGFAISDGAAVAALNIAQLSNKLESLRNAQDAIQKASLKTFNFPDSKALFEQAKKLIDSSSVLSAAQKKNADSVLGTMINHLKKNNNDHLSTLDKIVNGFKHIFNPLNIISNFTTAFDVLHHGIDSALHKIGLPAGPVGSVVSGVIAGGTLGTTALYGANAARLAAFGQGGILPRIGGLPGGRFGVAGAIEKFAPGNSGEWLGGKIRQFGTITQRNVLDKGKEVDQLFHPGPWVKGLFATDLPVAAAVTGATGNPLLGMAAGKAWGYGVEQKSLRTPANMVKRALDTRAGVSMEDGAKWWRHAIPTEEERQAVKDTTLAASDAAKLVGGPSLLARGATLVGKGVGGAVGGAAQLLSKIPGASLAGRVLGKVALPVGMALDAYQAVAGHGKAQSTGIGSLIGTGIGGAVGLAFGGVGAVPGAAIGGIVGSAIGHFWKQIPKFFSKGIPHALAGIGKGISHAVGVVGKAIPGIAEKLGYWLLRLPLEAIKTVVYRIPKLIIEMGIAFVGIVSDSISYVVKKGPDFIAKLGTGIWNALKGAFNWVVDQVTGFFKDPGKTIGKIVKGLPGKVVGGLIHGAGKALSDVTGGVLAGGIDNVPHDGFNAILHQGEMVLQTSEANRWRNAIRGNNSSPGKPSVDLSTYKLVEKSLVDHHVKTELQWTTHNKSLTNLHTAYFKDLNNQRSNSQQQEIKDNSIQFSKVEQAIQVTQDQRVLEYKDGTNKISEIVGKWVKHTFGLVKGLDNAIAPVGTSASIPAHASGGLVKGGRIHQGQLIRVGEEGHDEMVIPLAPHRRERAKSLISQARSRIADFKGGGVATYQGGVAARAPMSGPGYDNMFGRAKGVQTSRLDQGVDYAGISGPIGAIADGTITGIKQFSGFGQTIIEKLNDGRMVYYAMETGGRALSGIVGKRVKGGEAIAQGISSGSVEFGFANASGLPVQTESDHNIATGSAAQFANFIASGAAAGTGSGSAGLATAASANIPSVPRELLKMGALGKTLYQDLVKKRKSWQAIAGAASAGTGVSGSTFTGGKGAAKASVWTDQAMKLAGVSGSLWKNLLMRQESRESGFDPNSVNTTDINAQHGDPSRGILQTIGATFNQYKLSGHGQILNPIDNIAAAIRYMISRYGGGNAGTAANVMWARGGGAYANGGIVPSHKGGIAHVPHDNYKAILHEGEAVITKAKVMAGAEHEKITWANILKELKDIKGYNKEMLHEAKMAHAHDLKKTLHNQNPNHLTPTHLALSNVNKALAAGSLAGLSHGGLSNVDAAIGSQQASEGLDNQRAHYEQSTIGGLHPSDLARMQLQNQGAAAQASINLHDYADTMGQAGKATDPKVIAHLKRTYEHAKARATAEQKKLRGNIHGPYGALIKADFTDPYASSNQVTDAQQTAVGDIINFNRPGSMTSTANPRDPMSSANTQFFGGDPHAFHGKASAKMIAAAKHRAAQYKASGAPHSATDLSGTNVNDPSQIGSAPGHPHHAHHAAKYHHAAATKKHHDAKAHAASLSPDVSGASGGHDATSGASTAKTATHWADALRATHHGDSTIPLLKAGNHILGSLLSATKANHPLYRRAQTPKELLQQLARDAKTAHTDLGKISHALETAHRDLTKLGHASTVSHSDLRLLQNLARDHGLTAKQHLAVMRALYMTQRAIREESKARAETLRALRDLAKARNATLKALHKETIAHKNISRDIANTAKARYRLQKAQHETAKTHLAVVRKHRDIAAANYSLHKDHIALIRDMKAGQKAHLAAVKAHMAVTKALHETLKAHLHTTKALRDAVLAHHATTKVMLALHQTHLPIISTHVQYHTAHLSMINSYTSHLPVIRAHAEAHTYHLSAINASSAHIPGIRGHLVNANYHHRAIESYTQQTAHALNIIASWQPRQSHAGGLSRVPYDNYVANLHQDEMVLQAGEAAVHRSGAKTVSAGSLEKTLYKMIQVLDGLAKSSTTPVVNVHATSHGSTLETRIVHPRSFTR